MKTIKIFLLLVVAALTATTANAKIWRVNPKTNSGAKYHSIDDVLKDYEFAEGDTILCDPGDYGTVKITVPNVTLMGLGYDLNQMNSAVFESVFSVQNTTIIGIYAKSDITVGHNSTVTRCKTTNLYGTSSSDYFYSGYRNSCVITNCVVGHLYYFAESIIRNNLITNYLDKTKSSDVFNNTIYSDNPSYLLYINDISNCNIKDNIFINYKDPLVYFDFEKAAENNNAVSHNIFSVPTSKAPTLFPNGNKYGATVDNTFMMNTGDEKDYMLKANSMAKGAASHGGDCGMYGGAFPFVPYGVPQFMPRIIDANVPATPTDGAIEVTLTITTQNE